MFVPLLALSVLAAAPAPQLKLAAPGLKAVDLSAERATFISDYFADHLARAGQGRFSIITESQVAALLGFERQKQLLGCSDDASNCVAEIGGALGVDGLIVGSVARFGDTYAVTLRVLSTRDGSVLASVARSGLPEGALLDWTTEAASTLAHQLDPTLPEATATEVEGLQANELRLSILGVDYARRFGERFSVGGRTGMSLAWDFTGETRVLLHVALIGRYALVPYRGGWFSNAYLTAGLAVGDTGATMDGWAFSGGAEVGYRWLNASLELWRSGQSWVIAPGLAATIRF